ncbi:NAD(+) diphosphatase [Arcanobacterium haemolyticum]|nr:NAD(+) diphosphatase [Arcanobacterium haemolyticum]
MYVPELNLARGYIDRDELTRMDSSALASARHDEGARFILVVADNVAIDPATNTLAYYTRDEASRWDANSSVYLGRQGDKRYFACDGTNLIEPNDVQPDTPPLRPVRYWAHEWSDLDTALAVAGVAVLNWRRNARYCSQCGEELEVRHSGWEKACVNRHIVYPRTDPAVIMAIRDSEDRLLLGRNAAWGPGKYSVLAGFVEAGESLESAVRREVFEETRIEVDDVAYYGSQPWPFPRSLMLAFTGTTRMGEEQLSVDGKEMAHAHFFSRDEFRQALRSGEISLPTPTSVAASLIQSWLGEPFSKVMD